MRIAIGNAGWIAVDDVDAPGSVYVRVRLGERRLHICELFIEADSLSANDLRALPLSMIEAFINEHRDRVIERFRIPGPDLSTLASYFATTFGQPERELERHNWVAMSLLSQQEGSGIASVKPARRPAAIAPDRDFRLTTGPGPDGLTDEFLHNVARAYAAALARGEHPNKSIHEQTGYAERSVQRWVYTARQRGIMPRGQRGRAG